MRSKSSLALIEQSLMLLVFALAAALCLRAFLWAGQTAEENAARDKAVFCAQNAAETLKACGQAGGDLGTVLKVAAIQLDGSYAQGLMFVSYDEHWEPVSDMDELGTYCLCIQGIPESDGVWKAEIWVDMLSGSRSDPLFSLETAWQEVDVP